MIGVTKPLGWFPPTRDEIGKMPEDVKDEFGFRLRRLQNGAPDPNTKRFNEGNNIAHLIKIVVDGLDGNTYRAAVAAEFPEGLWVVDVFEKRSMSGIAAPKKDLDRIADRLKRLKAFRGTEDGREQIRKMTALFQENMDAAALKAKASIPRTPRGR